MRVHHHVVLSCGLSRDELERLWYRGKDKERLGITNADRLQFDRESLERLANYLTKYTNRKRRWRQSRALKAAAATAERRKYTEAAGTAGDERRGVRFGILAAEVSGLGDQRHNAHTKRCDKGMEQVPEASQDGPAKKKCGFYETSQILILNIPELQIN